jgi:LysR family transcriptional activator of nhaA
MLSQDLNYHHLRYFWMVAKLGSMTAAAERLNVRTQTLSTQVALLERSIGRALFQPQGRGLALTEAGRAALRYADQIFQLGDQLTDALRDEALDNTLRLSVGIADALPKAVTYHTLEPVLALPRQVRITCSEGSFDELCSELVQHKIDLVLAERPAASASSHLRVTKLFEYPVSVFAHPRLMKRLGSGFPANLHKAPFLLPARGNVLRPKLEHWFETVGVEPVVVGEFDDLALLETFGLAGMGVFALPVRSPVDMTTDAGGTLSTGASLHHMGNAADVREEFFAFAHPRSLQHPALRVIFSSSDQAAGQPSSA